MEVQKFLNSISTKELQPERGIFQQGSLRKVIYHHNNCYTSNICQLMGREKGGCCMANVIVEYSDIGLLDALLK